MDASIQAGSLHTTGSSINDINHVDNPPSPRVFELEQRLTELQSKLNAVTDDLRRQKLTYDERDFRLKRKLSYLLDSVQADRPENLDNFDLVAMVDVFDDALRNLGMKLVRVTASPSLIWEEAEKSMERLVNRIIEALVSRQVSNPDSNQGTEVVMKPVPIPEYHESLGSQLSSVSNLVRAQRDNWEALKEDKRKRETEKNGRTSELLNMVRKIYDELSAERVRAEETRMVAASKPGIEIVLEELARQNQETRNLVNTRWEDKRERRAEKDHRADQLRDTLQKLGELAAEVRELGQRIELKPDNEQVLGELLQQNHQEQREILNSFSETWRVDTARQHDDTVNAIRSTASEQVPFNVQGYLGEFSQALSAEVRILLSEVGKLHEERRTLQFEIGSLLSTKSKYGPEGEFGHGWKTTSDPGKEEVGKLREERRILLHEIGDLILIRSKYGPGGDFDVDWKPPPLNSKAPPSPPATPPSIVSNHLQEQMKRNVSKDQAETPSSALPAWLNACLETAFEVEKQHTSPGITSIPAPPPPPHSTSAWKDVPKVTYARLPPPPPPPPPPPQLLPAWATWQPDPNMVPTPPSVQIDFLVPDRGSPGLFGPPSPPAVEPRAQVDPQEPERSWATWSPGLSGPSSLPAVEPRTQVGSWATWQPDPNMVPTPSSQPNLIVPDRGSPGLFGPRSP